MVTRIPNRSAGFRTPLLQRIALLALGSVFWACAAHAGIIEIGLDHYVVSVGKPRANYFDGKLLTADDLDQEQSYKGSGKRYLPPTNQPLTDVLQSEGFASVVLLLDEETVSANYFSAANPDNRFGDNFIVLDPQHGTWRGRLFVEELGDIRQGVYDELSGSYRGFAPVPEPSPLLLVLLAIGGIAVLRTSRKS